MNRRNFASTVVAVCAVTAFGYQAAAQSAPAKNVKVKGVAFRNAPAGPSTAAVFALEKKGWEAWKKRDPKTFEKLLSDRYVGFGQKGRLDKAAAMKSLTTPNCDIRSYSLSDEQMHMLGADVAVLTFKAAQDFTCDGKKGPANVWASSVYVREGYKWRNVFYVENPVADPNAPAPGPVAAATAVMNAEFASDPLTGELMAVEARAWDAWKNRDSNAMGNLTTSHFMYVSGDGRLDKAASLKVWSEPKCEGLAYVHTEPRSVQLSKDVALVTYKADVQGSCDGRPTPPSLWVASFNQKAGTVWKNAFYTDAAR